MQRTTPTPLNQEPDRNSLTFSIPRGLIPIPILSHTEQMIISRITSLSNKYSTKGGCNLPNKALADRHECAISTVSIALSKATWLGMLQFREDQIDKHPNKDGTTSITQRRRLKLVIPRIWEYFGELWADFYFKGDEEAKQILDWMKNYVNKKFKQKTHSDKLDLLKMIKMMVLEFKRGPLEKQMAPFINQKDTILEDPMLFMFTKLNVSESKCLNNTPSDKSLEKSTQNEIDPNSSNKTLSAKERNEIYIGTAKLLAKIIQTNKNIIFPVSRINQWANEIRKLVETNKVKHKRVREALRWYKKNIGGDYIPVIESGAALREKFMKLEAAIERERHSKNRLNKPLSRGATPIPGKYPDYDILYDSQKGIIDDKREANGRRVE